MRKKEDSSQTYAANPSAVAHLSGSPQYPDIRGRVIFYQLIQGILVQAEVEGLPLSNGSCSSPIFAFHLHSGTQCSGNTTDPFADVGGHYNPENCPHPYHAGDMPPLFTVNGRAYLSFMTDRFTLSEIIGRTVIIHSGVDDFTTQPAGAAGDKIACGVITATA